MKHVFRSTPLLRRGYPLAGGALLLALTFSIDEAYPQERLAVVETAPIVIEGAILAVGVRIRNADSSSKVPGTADLILEDGRRIETLVAWLGLMGPEPSLETGSWWTRPQIPLRVVDAPSNRAERMHARGFLLCELPAGYRGSFRYGETTIRPRWLSKLEELEGEPLEARVGPAWPVLDDPGEWWRWELLAERLGRTPPEPVGDERMRLLAHHFGGLWRVAIDRLRQTSPGTASEVRDLLTARCMTADGDLVAAWITDPVELQSLLDLMLNPDRSEMLVVRSVLSFLDARFPLLFWVDVETGVRARIAVANPTDGEQVAQMQWIEGDPIPSALIVPSGRVSEVLIDRPPIQSIGPPSSLRRTSPGNELVFSVNQLEHRLHLASERIEARPPGVRFGPFFRSMSLADAWAGRSRIPPANQSTTAVLRKRADRWEIFLECFVPAETHDPSDTVEVHLGPPEAPIRVIRVGSDGQLAFTPAGARFRGASVRVRRFVDRWRAIITLEPAIVASASASGSSDTLQIGLRRLLGGRIFSVAGGATPPWNSSPPIYFVALSEWGDIRPAGSGTAATDDATLYSNP